MIKPHNSIYIFALLFIALVIFATSCRKLNEPDSENVPYKQNNSVWFRQAIVDLGAHIEMVNSHYGFASSRGRGNDVPGQVYRFSNGQWNTIITYPYSDSPLISFIDSTSVTLIHHLIHTGNCRPIMKEWRSGNIHEIPLPKLMWDHSDFVIFNGMSRLDNKSACMVGQQGHILIFDGLKWKESESPLLKSEKSNMYEGDLNDVSMISSKSAWAVGRGGVILRYINGKWNRFNSPTSNDLLKISFADENHGWIVGDKGTLLEFNRNQWRIIPLGIQQKLTSVKALDSTHVWIVGISSTLLAFNGKTWTTDESIKAYEDTFADVDAVRDSSGKINIWIIGNGGIYTNSQSLGFSFTDITSQASLRRTGRGGIFFNRTDNNFPDLLVLGDGGPNLLFSNNGQNIYSEASLGSNFGSNVHETKSTALGDINNDGALDILEFRNNMDFRFLLGSSSGRFRSRTDRSQFRVYDDTSVISIGTRFVDFDNDGNLDAYFSNNDSKDNLFRNDGTGKFENVYDSSSIMKMLNHRSFGATFGDFNNDGLADIVIPYYVSENKRFLDFFLNDGNFKFYSSLDSSFFTDENVAPTVCVTADFNNDGNLDIIVHNQGAPPWFLLNDGNTHFRRISSEFGFTEPIFQPDPNNGTIATGDVNNDGWIDLFIASKLFLNQHGDKFLEVTNQSGIQFTGHPSFADIDNDGDLDLFIGSSENSLGKGDRAALYRNNLNNGNFIKVRVYGDISNRCAIGAKVFVEDNLYSSQKQLRVVGLGSSPMLVQDIFEIHFGVPSEKIFTVHVKFPSGIVRTLEQVSAGSILDVYESSPIPRTAVLTSNYIKRTILMADLMFESIKIFVALLIIIAMIIGGIKIGAGKFTRRFYFPFGCAIIYLALLHITITEGQLFSTLVSFGVMISLGLIAIAIARMFIRRREARCVSHYKLLELLGHGGMGRVFKATDINTKQIVAIKLLNPEIIKDAENKKRLLSEGQLLSTFSHPHIIKVFEVSDTNTGGFIAMEYLSGGTLKQLLEQSHPLPFDEINRILLQVCEGLKEVHTHGIVHRDIKSGNIMFDGDRNVRIMDFGLSKSPLVTTMTSLGTVLGTLGYVAPEQITNQNVDQRTDIFSLGVVIYELLTNTLPFKGENEIALIHSIFNVIPPPPSFLRDDGNKFYDFIVMKCLSKNPDERFANVDELKKLLQV